MHAANVSTRYTRKEQNRRRKRSRLLTKRYWLDSEFPTLRKRILYWRQSPLKRQWILQHLTGQLLLEALPIQVIVYYVILSFLAYRNGEGSENDLLIAAAFFISVLKAVTFILGTSLCAYQFDKEAESGHEKNSSHRRSIIVGLLTMIFVGLIYLIMLTLPILLNTNNLFISQLFNDESFSLEDAVNLSIAANVLMLLITFPVYILNLFHYAQRLQLSWGIKAFKRTIIFHASAVIILILLILALISTTETYGGLFFIIVLAQLTGLLLYIIPVYFFLIWFRFHLAAFHVWVIYERIMEKVSLKEHLDDQHA